MSNSRLAGLKIETVQKLVSMMETKQTRFTPGASASDVRHMTPFLVISSDEGHKESQVPDPQVHEHCSDTVKAKRT